VKPRRRLDEIQAIKASQNPCLAGFLKQLWKKSNHDCFSFVQRKRQLPMRQNPLKNMHQPLFLDICIFSTTTLRGAARSRKQSSLFLF